MKVRVVAVAIAAVAAGAAGAQSAGVAGTPAPIVLVDSTGKAAARPLHETVVLVTIGSGVVAPALIRAIQDPDGRAMSALATWQSGGSVLFTSTDCTAGAHVHALSTPGVRASAQVRTPAGIVLHVGAVGTATTVAIRSILYDTGCTPVTIRQSGLFPVLATVNLDAAYPPPLSFQ
jgi:hypothetical protein